MSLDEVEYLRRRSPGELTERLNNSRGITRIRFNPENFEEGQKLLSHILNKMDLASREFNSERFFFAYEALLNCQHRLEDMLELFIERGDA
jgi:hypothetical protein